MSELDVVTTGFVRPPSAAARIAALKDRLNPSTRPIPLNGEYDTKTLDTITQSIKKWLDGLENLADPVSETGKLKNDDKSSSSERVHKIPPKQNVLQANNERDVEMIEAPVEDSNAIQDNTLLPTAVTSNQVPTPRISIVEECNTNSAPLSPPAKKFRDLNIHPIEITSQANTQDAASATIPKPNAYIATEIVEANTKQNVLNVLETVEKVSNLEQVTSAHTINNNLIPIERDPVPDQKNNSFMQLYSSSSSSSSIKKRRLSNPKTVLDLLIEKRAKNAVFYDGATQKFFHNLVLELSGGIQSIKKEKRFIMFAKDLACKSLLDNLDSSLQEALKVVESASFDWLKGRPDWKTISSVKIRLCKAEEDIQTFVKLGWKMNDGDETESEEDDDEEVKEGENKDEGEAIVVYQPMYDKRNKDHACDNNKA